MKRLILTWRVSLAVFAGLFLSGCNSAGPPVGTSCTVQFRRDALGAGASLPVPPTTEAINGAAVSISGQLKAVYRDWVVLDQAGGDVWIPRDVVLLIQVQEK